MEQLAIKKDAEIQKVKDELREEKDRSNCILLENESLQGQIKEIRKKFEIEEERILKLVIGNSEQEIQFKNLKNRVRELETEVNSKIDQLN